MKRLVIILALALACGETARAQAVGYPEVQLTPDYAADTGSANALVATVLSCPTAYTSGQTIRVLPGHANTTTTPTLNFCNLGTKTITKFGQSALAASDLLTTAIAVFIYDGTDMELQNPATLGTAAQINTLLQGLTGCSTANYVLTPAGSDCVAAGSGTVTDGSGTTTANYMAESTSSAHVIGYDTAVSDNGTTFSYSGTGGIAATGGSVSEIQGTAIASPAAPGGSLYNLYVNSTSDEIECDYGATPTACVPSYTNGSSSSFNSNANLTMTSTSTFYDGPTTGSLSAGTYFVTETLTLGKASATAPAYALCKLWDGTTAFAAAYPGMPYVTSAAITYTTVTLSAVITESGGATIKTSCEPQTGSEIMYYTTPVGSLNFGATISWVRLK